MDGKRLRTHNNATTEGKIFVIFIALIIRSEIFRRMEIYLSMHNMSLKNAIQKLNNIKAVEGNDGKRMLKSITKEQRQLLECIELDKKIEDSITNL